MQLSAKALLKPFNALTNGFASEDGGNTDFDEDPEFDGGFDSGPHDDEDHDDDDDEDEDVMEHGEEFGNDDDGEDPLEQLDSESREELLQSTASVRATLSKVCSIPKPLH